MLKRPAELPMKVLLDPVVLQSPAQLPMKVLSVPVVVVFPADPAKKLRVVVLPKNLRALSMTVFPQI
jgi:hypothetical protein